MHSKRTFKVALTAIGLAVACSAIFLSATGVQAEEKSKRYSIASSVNPTTLKAKSDGTFSITITPAEGFVLKTATPFKAKLVGSEGVELEKVKFSNKDFKDAQAAAKTVETTLKASKAGSHSVKAALTFFVCDDTLCERFKDSADVQFKVN